MPNDYTIKILLEPELHDDGWHVRETWSGPHEGLGSPWPTIWGPMAPEIVTPFMQERVGLLEAYKEKWKADFESRLNFPLDQVI